MPAERIAVWPCDHGGVKVEPGPALNYECATCGAVASSYVLAASPGSSGGGQLTPEEAGEALSAMAYADNYASVSSDPPNPVYDSAQAKLRRLAAGGAEDER